MYEMLFTYLEYHLAGDDIMWELLTHHLKILKQSSSRVLFQSGFDEMNDVKHQANMNCIAAKFD